MKRSIVLVLASILSAGLAFGQSVSTSKTYLNSLSQIAGDLCAEGEVVSFESSAAVCTEGGGSGSDTTCLDAGVDCLFAASASEGGAATDLACTGCVSAAEVASDVATQAELDAVAGAAPNAHASTHGDGGADEVTITEAQISDLAHTVDTDDQTAPEVAYTPTTGGDWSDPDPADVGDALDTLASDLGSLDTTADDLSDNVLGDIGNVSEASADAGDALVSDGAGAWSPVDVLTPAEAAAAYCALTGCTLSPAGTTDIALTIQQPASSTGDLIRALNSSASEVFSVDSNGWPTISSGAANAILYLGTTTAKLQGGSSQNVYLQSGAGGGLFLWTASGGSRIELGKSGDTGQLDIYRNKVNVKSGDLSIEAGGIIYGDAGTKPTCSADPLVRGKTHTGFNGAGVADTHEICLKNAADVYAWVPLATP